MRIIFSGPTAYEDIAMTMLNMELGVERFRNGKELPAPHAPYPKYTIDSNEYRVKMARGFIYISQRVHVESFIEKIRTIIDEVSKNYGLPLYDDVKVESADLFRSLHIGNHPRGAAHLVRRQIGRAPAAPAAPPAPVAKSAAAPGDWVSIGNSLHAVVKAKVRATRALLTDHEYDKSMTHLRYVWVVSKFIRIPQEMDDEYATLDTRFCSIVYDFDNVVNRKSIEEMPIEDSKLPKALPFETYEFSIKNLVGYRNVVWCGNDPETIFLSRYFNPVAFEMSNFWLAGCPQGENITDVHRNISKVFLANFRDLKIDTVSQNGELRNDICHECRTPLYGEIYVMSVLLEEPDIQCSVAICPLCVHLGQTRYEKTYVYVYRVQYPRTLAEAIDLTTVSPVKKQIMKAAARGVQRLESPIRWVLGDEYMVFPKISTYLYSHLSSVSTLKVIALDSRIGTHSWILSPK